MTFGIIQLMYVILCAPNRFSASIDARMKCALTFTLSSTITVALTRDSAALEVSSTGSLAMLGNQRIPNLMFG